MLLYIEAVNCFITLFVFLFIFQTSGNRKQPLIILQLDIEFLYNEHLHFIVFGGASTLMDVTKRVEVFPTGLVIVCKGKRAKKQTRTQTTTRTQTIFERFSNYGFSLWLHNIRFWCKQLGLDSASSAVSSFGCQKHIPSTETLWHSRTLVYKPADIR